MAISTKTASEKAEIAKPSTVVLELVKLSRYVRQDILYEKGIPYRFTTEQAAVLFEEMDEVTGVPLWKHYKSPAQKMVVQREMVPADMTGKAVDAPDMSGGEGKRLEIGDDSEIAELLQGGDAEDSGVNV